MYNCNTLNSRYQSNIRYKVLQTSVITAKIITYWLYIPFQ